MQIRYEALRSYFVENLKAKEVAEKFGYSLHTVYALLKKYKKKKSPEFFISPHQGPKNHRDTTKQIKEKIISLRKM